MSKISISLYELTAFFECTPTTTEEGVDWPYNDFMFEKTVDNIFISLSLFPAYKDAHLIVSSENHIIYELNVTGISDVKYISQDYQESLLLVLSKTEHLQIQLAPQISVQHTFSNT